MPTGSGAGGNLDFYPDSVSGSGRGSTLVFLEATMAGLLKGKQVRDDFLKADAQHRAKIATGFFDEATVDDLFASAAIDTDRLKEGADFVQRDGSVAMTGALPMGSQKITGLADGTATTDAATYGQVQAISAGLDPKESVRAVTTQKLDDETDISGSPSYNNTGGSSGRGQITATLAVSGTFGFDGVTLADGDRILLKNEGDSGGMGGDANGIYTVGISGTALTLDRATDFDADAEVTAGAYAPAEEGTANGDKLWILTTNNPITIGGASGTALVFNSFGSFTLGGTPSTIQCDDSAAEGSSSNAARADHTHAIVCAAPGTALDGNTTNAEGSATSFSRSDHAHDITTAAPSAALTKSSTNAEGSAAGLARADHSHEVTFVDPSALNKGMTPSATSGNYQTTGLTIGATPEGYVGVHINHLGPYELGDGVRTTDCYFSSDGGSTAKAIASIASGDTLYWNGTIAGFDLETDDVVDLCFDT